MSGDKLLREYIREVLKEDDGGFGGDGTYWDLAIADATSNPWGVSFGSGEDLYNIFVKPFADVFQTAAGKAKELSQKTQTLLRVTFEAVVTSIIPILTDSYNEIFEKDKAAMEKIRQEYAEVYQSNWDAFKDEDAQLLLFMYDPARYVLGKVAKQSPKAALGLISVVTGGALDGYIAKIKHYFGWDKEPDHKKDKENKNIDKALSGMGIGWEMPGAMESVIREDDGQQKLSFEQVLSNPKLIAKVDNSPVARKMRSQAQQLVHQSLTRVFKEARAVLGANSLQDLQNKLGKRIPGVEKLAQLPPQQRQAAEQQVMVGVKKSMKTFYIKSMEQQLKKVAQGMGPDHPLVRDYQSVLGKIKAL